MSGPGVWITGPSRSGTSMTAGLFAAHGVFFGECGDGDRFNPKGYWEHPELVGRVEQGIKAGWPEAWWKRIRGEGWEDGTPWGVKRGPLAWPWVQELEPTVIVMTHRPVEEIKASRRRWGRAKRTRKALAKAESLLDRILGEASCPVVHVQTAEFIAGKYGTIIKAFGELGVAFDPSLAAGWIDPALWNRGLK